MGYYREPQSPSLKAHQRKMRLDQGTAVLAFEAQRGDYQPSWIENLSIRLKCQPACTEHVHTPKKKSTVLSPAHAKKKVQLRLICCVPTPFIYSHSSNVTNVTHGSP